MLLFDDLFMFILFISQSTLGKKINETSGFYIMFIPKINRKNAQMTISGLCLSLDVQTFCIVFYLLNKMNLLTFLLIFLICIEPENVTFLLYYDLF